MVHKGTKEIETERLILRQFNKDDAEAMFKNWESDSKVTEFLRWPTAIDISEAEQVLNEWIHGYENLDFYQWAIVLKEILPRVLVSEIWPIARVMEVNTIGTITS